MARVAAGAEAGAEKLGLAVWGRDRMGVGVRDLQTELKVESVVAKKYYMNQSAWMFRLSMECCCLRELVKVRILVFRQNCRTLDNET